MNYVTGFKHETARDLSVSLNGYDFALSRSYSSDPLLVGGSGWVGNNWQLFNLHSLQFGSAALDSRQWLREDLPNLPERLWLVRPNQASVAYWQESNDGNVAVYTLPDVVDARIELRAVGGSPTSPLELVQVVDGTLEAVFRNEDVEKTVSSVLYEDGGSITYTFDVVPNSGGIGTRPSSILLNGTREIRLLWSTGQFVSAGKLLQAELIDTTVPIGDPQRSLGRVDYTYAVSNFGGGLNAFTLGRLLVPASNDVGTVGDLIQVTRYTPMHLPVGAPDDFVTITQYRYHNGVGLSVGSPVTIEATGDAGALKAVLPAANIEAALFASAYDPATTDFVTEAEKLLALDDAPATGIAPIDIASKIVSYDGASGLVETQYTRSGCGCGGGGSSTEEEFIRISYVTAPAWTTVQGRPGHSVQVTEASYDSGTWIDERINYFDFVRLSYSESGAPYLVNSVIEDPDHPGVYWVTHYEYTERYNTEFIAQPSTTAAYTPASGGNPPVWQSVASGGLVEYRQYDANQYLVSRYIGDHVPQEPSLARNVFTRLDRRTRDATRPWLVTQYERFRSETNQTSADEIETTSYAYGFHSGTDVVAWRATTVEAELDDVENGPSGSGNTYASYAMFDVSRNTVWSLSADGEVVRLHDRIAHAINEPRRSPSHRWRWRSLCGI